MLLLCALAAHAAPEPSASPAAVSAGTSAPASAPARATSAEPARRPKVGLVLSGGGARGLTHIGVLRVLEEMRIPIDYIAATSMGAIVGGLYSSGTSPAEMEKQMTSADWPTLFSDSPPRQDLGFRRKEEDAQYPLAFEIGFRGTEFRMFKGALSGSNLELFLHELARKVDDVATFDQLPIPYRAVATDMITGKEVVFDRGPLYKAMRASMSVPGMFAPAEIEGRILGDGGLVKNLPVGIVKAMGAEVVIAVNIGTPLMSREQLSSVVGYASQMINILTEQNVREQLALLGPGDILISPDLGALTFVDFTAGPRFIELGAKAAAAVRDRLARLSVPETQYAQYQAGLLVHVDQPPKSLDFIRFEGTEYANAEVLAEQMETRAGERFDLPTLHKDVVRLYGRGDMELIDYRLVDEGASRGLVIEVNEKSWGPNYLRFGVSLSSDLHGDSGFKVLMGHKRMWINPLGAEWRNDFEAGRLRRYATEFYQPLSVGNYAFGSAGLLVQNRPELLFSGDTAVAEYSVGEGRVFADLGVSFGVYGEARLGYRYSRVKGDPVVAAAEFPSLSITESGARLLARWDSLDYAFFPTRGVKGEIEAFSGRRTESEGSRDLGAYPVHRVHAAVDGTVSLSKDAVVHVGGRVGVMRTEYTDVLTDYNLGGFLNLSGYRIEQLTGSSLVLMRGVYQHRIATASWLGRSGIYAGGSIEAGNVWDSRNDISLSELKLAGSLFLAADTWLGPLYFAWGRATGNHQAFYIFLGRP